MADGQAPPHQIRLVLQIFLLGVALFSPGKLSAQIQGSAGQEGTKPFTATVALREGYDSNPLTQSYQSTTNVVSSTYSSVQPSLGYNYTGLQADLALRYDFTGTYFPSINQSYDLQYSQAFIGRYTYAFDPRTSLTVSDNFIYSEQPVPTLVSAGLAPITNTQGFINNLGTIQADYRVTDRLAMVTRWNNSILNSDGLYASDLAERFSVPIEFVRENVTKAIMARDPLDDAAYLVPVEFGDLEDELNPMYVPVINASNASFGGDSPLTWSEVLDIQLMLSQILALGLNPDASVLYGSLRTKIHDATEIGVTVYSPTTPFVDIIEQAIGSKIVHLNYQAEGSSEPTDRPVV
ncbi:hypothetical protein EBY67_01310, partial [bacterium]|nr:hypothetical protein [bacterium]